MLGIFSSVILCREAPLKACEREGLPFPQCVF